MYPPSDPAGLVGVVLCGGRSTRMGRDKAQLKTSDGKTFSDVAIERLKPLCDHVCFSSSRPMPGEHPTIVDPPDSHGPISGLLASLEYAARRGGCGCLVNPVDTPRLTTGDLQRLVDSFRHHTREIICATSHPQATFLEPLIAIYPIGVIATLHAAIGQKHYSLQNVLRQHGCVRVALPKTSCRNFNTPSDLAEL